MWRTLAGSALILGLLPQSASAELTATAAIASLRSDATMQAFVFGIGTGLGWANADLVQKKLPPLYCPPPNVASEGAAVDLLESYVRKTPTAGKFPPGVVILMAFRDRWPCAESSGPQR
jgi:hypothetical protein